MQDLISGARLALHDPFQFLGVCIHSGCGKFIGQNASYDVLNYNMKKHFRKHHGELPPDFKVQVILPPNIELDGEGLTVEMLEPEVIVKEEKEEKKKVKQVVPKVEVTYRSHSCS